MFIVKFMGGLGNQLWQLNFYNYLKKKYPHAKIKINISYYKEDARHGGFMLNAFKAPRIKFFVFSHYRLMNDRNYVEDFSENDNILFEGYWQNTRFLADNTLTFENACKGKMNDGGHAFLKQITETRNAVSIHVRCGDYDNLFDMGNIATKAYYNNAVSKIIEVVQNPSFFVFSNNIAWTKKNVDFHGNPVHFVTCNNKPEDAKWDLFLMSKCRHNIISNSSFSWWGQYFNKAEDKCVITPPYWTSQTTPCFSEAVPDIQRLSYMLSVPNVPSFSNTQPALQEKAESVTVVLVVYDGDAMQIRRSLSCIYNQPEAKAIECIVLAKENDAASLAILEGYQNLLSNRLKVIKMQDMDVPGNIIKQILPSLSCDYVIFTDTTHYFMLNAFEKIFSLISDNHNAECIEFCEQTHYSSQEVSESLCVFENMFCRIYQRRCLGSEGVNIASITRSDAVLVNHVVVKPQAIPSAGQKTLRSVVKKVIRKIVYS